MAQVYLGLGSNIEPAAHLRLAIAELRRRFGDLALSPVYRGRAIGFVGDDFLNMVVGLRTALEPEGILREIEDIHRMARRERNGKTLQPRTLDIDLLLYDDLVVDVPGRDLPRADVLDYAFVLRPLAELAPELVHPVTGRTMDDHWRDFDAASQPLTRVDLDL